MRTLRLPSSLAIPLLPEDSGAVALVDEADFWELAEHEWRLLQVDGLRYAFRNARGADGSMSMTYMHRAIANAGAGEVVDHIDGDGLNNTRANLRICTQADNLRNRRKPRHYRGVATSSQFKGVTWMEREKRWSVYIGTDSERKFIGLFSSEIEAARAYDEAARQHHGEFARLNFPEAGEQAA